MFLALKIMPKLGPKSVCSVQLKLLLHLTYERTPISLGFDFDLDYGNVEERSARQRQSRLARGQIPGVTCRELPPCSDADSPNGDADLTSLSLPKSKKSEEPCP